MFFNANNEGQPSFYEFAFESVHLISSPNSRLNFF